VRAQRLIERSPRSPIFSTRDAHDPAFAALQRSELIGRPLGDNAFLDAIGRRLDRLVTPRSNPFPPSSDSDLLGRLHACRIQGNVILYD
jgi:hypothetical protein